MAKMFDYELAQVSKKMIEELFNVKKGEIVILTADSGSDMDMVENFAAAAFAVGGKPMVVRVPRTKGEGQDAVPDLPAEALTGALLHADVWIEFNTRCILYSDIWETVMRENKKLRYLDIYDASVELLCQIINKVDVNLMGELLKPIQLLLQKASKVRITTARGTYLTFELDSNHIVDMDDGNYQIPKFGTLPGYVNVVPKFGTMNGAIVWDSFQEIGGLKDNRVEFTIENGRIVDFIGGQTAKSLQDFVENFQDENMFKIAHVMISLNPGVPQFTGSLVIDERIYGGVCLGFGHTSPVDAPPLGQPAVSHFDGMLEKASIWIDDTQITHNGVVVLPPLVPIAEALLEFAKNA